jgi:protein-S-isoprenylcysteine O-methyltransferase Ste14
VLFLKNLLFTILVPGTIAILIPVALGGDVSNSVGRFGVATQLFVFGAAIYGWCVWDFATFGGGTPAPIDAPKRLVVRGLYRCVRNPMYIGVLLVIGGMIVLHDSWVLIVYGVVVWLCFDLFVRLYEEPRLQREFGSEYEAYRAEVSRWLPGIPRRVNAAHEP